MTLRQLGGRKFVAWAFLSSCVLLQASVLPRLDLDVAVIATGIYVGGNLMKGAIARPRPPHER